MEVLEDEKGTYLQLEQEEYDNLLNKAKEIFKFKGKTKKTYDKYINKLISLALITYIEELDAK